MSVKIGVIAALPFEAACFANSKIRPGTYQITAQNSFVYHAGMGPENAADAAQALIDLNVDALVSWGVAGALDSKLVSGDIILPAEVIGSDQQRYTVNQRWYTALKNKLNKENMYCGGSIVSAHDVQHDSQKKMLLRQSSQAQAVDMESVAVARVANRENKPYVAIRIIFDTVSMRIPSSSIHATDQYGIVSVPRLIAGLTRHPSELRQYPHLMKSFAKAKKSLYRVVALCGNELCFAEEL